MSEARLEVLGVMRHYPSRQGSRHAAPVKAVDGVDLRVEAGQTLAIVGESGCGKSTLARLIAGLDQPNAGRILHDGKPLVISARTRRENARRVQIVFQDPYSSLNPRMRAGDIVAEPLEGQGITRGERRERVKLLLEAVGLPPAVATRLPHQFSGGQRQRLAIARALSIEPGLLVLDEPVSALDVSVRAQILNLLASLHGKASITSILISHDLSVVEYLADRIAVMYLGKIVEVGDAQDIFSRPLHPYTRQLLSAIPRFGAQLKVESANISRELSNGAETGCNYAARCPYAIDLCRTVPPLLKLHDSSAHPVACHRVAELPTQVRPEEEPQSQAFTKRLVLLRRYRDNHATSIATAR